jgi:DNA-binding response OmpR family regulator
VTILLIEDNEGLSKLIQLKARRLGWEVFSFENGQLGYDWFLENSGLPDVLVLDLMLPGMSGWEILAKIEDLPVIALTIKSREEDLSRLFKHKNVVDVINKPAHLTRLFEVLEKFVK